METEDGKEPFATIRRDSDHVDVELLEAIWLGAGGPNSSYDRPVTPGRSVA